MSQAESLLNSLSETTNTTTSSPINDLLIIDGNSRIVNVPATEILFGVKTDVNAERKYFLAPRYVGDNIDLSLLTLQVHYKNAVGDKYKYNISDVEAAEEHITFSWLLGGNLFKEKGTVYFAVRAIKIEDGIEACVWNTAIASGTVLDGLVAYDYNDPNEPDGGSGFNGLPSVTENDNDKTLLVVDGKWTLVPTEIPEDVIDGWFDETTEL